MQALDFSAVMRDARAGFVARPEAERRILAAVGTAGPGLVLVVGGPGTGKTTLAAQLISAHRFLHHFLRPGHVPFGLWRDPHAFLVSIGFQLLERFGPAIFPPAVRIDALGKISDVRAGASVVVAEIDRFLALPWTAPPAHTVELDASRIAGSVVGIRYRQVVQEVRQIPAPAFREIALLDPLRRLREAGNTERIVLWVDGLDEEIDGGAGAITALIPDAAEISRIGNLAIVASSRPGPHLDRLIASGAIIIDLDEVLADETSSVAAAYHDNRLSDPAVADALSALGRTPADIRAVLAGQSNFLYLQTFFDGLAGGHGAALLEGELPPELDAIHARLLGELEASVGAAFAATVRPILGLLAVAEGLDRKQLIALSGLDSGSLDGTLARLAPFLRRASGESDAALYLHHGSFRECLVDKRHAAAPWHIDREAACRDVARHYLAFERDGWRGMDAYGFTALTQHMLDGGPETRRQLAGFDWEPWRQARRRHDRSHAGIVGDLARAARATAALPPVEAVARTVGLALVALRLDMAGRELPQGSLEAMIALGEVNRALACLRPGLETGAALSRIRRIVTSLDGGDAAARDLAGAALAQGLDLLEADAETSHADLYNLLVGAQRGPGRDKLLERATVLFNRCPRHWGTAMAAGELGRLLTDIAAEPSRQAFAAARQALEAAKYSYGLACRRLFGAWAQADPAAALQGVDGLPLRRADHSMVATLLDLGRVAARSGAADPAPFRATAERVLAAIADPYHLALARLRVAEDDADNGRRDAAGGAIAEAEALAGRIGGDDDPERDVQNRIATATDVLAESARLRTALGLPEADAAIDRAWTALAAHGAFERSAMATALVSAQLGFDPDLLEAYLDRIADRRLRADLLGEAARQLAAKDAASRNLAATLLEEALACSEAAGAGVGNLDTSAFAGALATAHPGDGHDARLARLRASGASEQDILFWRLDMLEVLSRENAPEAAAWLDATLDGFNGNLGNFAFAAAGFVRHLLPTLLADIGDRIGTVGDPLNRMLLRGAMMARMEPARSGSDPAALLQSVAALAHAPELPRWPMLSAKILAFLAGQWWEGDRALSDRLWLSAILAAEAETDERDRQERLAELAGIFAVGAPAAALERLLPLTREPPAPPGVVFIVPGARTSPYAAGGMTTRDALLIDAYAAAHRAGLLDLCNPALPASTPVAAACVDAARDRSLPLFQAKRLLQRGLGALGEGESHQIKCLVRAEAATALDAIGARREAASQAAAVARDIISNGAAFGSVHRLAPYGRALGRCFGVLAGAGDAGTLSALIWESRRADAALLLALPFLAAPLAAADAKAPALLEQSMAAAAALFAEALSPRAGRG